MILGKFNPQKQKESGVRFSEFNYCFCYLDFNQVYAYKRINSKIKCSLIAGWNRVYSGLFSGNICIFSRFRFAATIEGQDAGFSKFCTVC